MEFSYEHNGEIYRIEISKRNEQFVVKLDNQTYSLMEVQERPGGLLKFELNRRPHKCRVAASGELRHIFIDGNVYQLKKIRKTKPGAPLINKKGRKSKNGIDPEEAGKIKSPINGKIIRVWVEASSVVKPEQDLLIIEAMKMEHRIKSPAGGKIKKVHVKEGDQVELGAMLIELEVESKPKISAEE